MAKLSFIKTCLVFLLPFVLITCTEQSDLNIERSDDTYVLNERSTQAECDSIENELQNDTVQDACAVAELLECRLNQGVDESYVMQRCDYNETYDFIDCTERDDIFDDWQTLVANFKTEVADNTDECPPGCSDPDPYLDCRTAIFTVTCNGSCGTGQLSFDIEADVYCCDD